VRVVQRHGARDQNATVLLVGKPCQKSGHRKFASLTRPWVTIRLPGGGLYLISGYAKVLAEPRVVEALGEEAVSWVRNTGLISASTNQNRQTSGPHPSGCPQDYSTLGKSFSFPVTRNLVQ
jgi:hypothetical protein